MLYQLKRHPFAVAAHFRHSLVLTYAYPPEALRPLLPPGLELDEWRRSGFLAIALVQTERLRPALLPEWMGGGFFLAGYRVFVTHRDAQGRTRRGLRILRSHADRAAMRFFGNLLTHYDYRPATARVVESAGGLEIETRTPGGEADLHVVAHLDGREVRLPEGSPFGSWHEARRFAGPLPNTFDYEPQTHSIIRIRGVRDRWDPRPVAVQVLENAFLRLPPLDGCAGTLASAFHLSGIGYRWERGVREVLAGGAS